MFLLPLKAWQTSTTYPLLRLAQFSVMQAFSSSTFCDGVLHALLSTYHHTLLSRVLRFRLWGGHVDLGQKSIFFFEEGLRLVGCVGGGPVLLENKFLLASYLPHQRGYGCGHDVNVSIGVQLVATVK